MEYLEVLGLAIVEVVKYNGTPDVFAWKYPNEELGTWTQLIVNESQEALLFKGGQALDLFGSGSHTLSTANIPLLSKLVNLPFGGRSPFAAEVWYVNKAHSLDIKWGTATPIQLQDPKYGVFIPLRSFGQFGIQIEDARKFLIKLVGTLPSFSKQDLLQFFRGLFMTKVKDSISSYLVHKQISLLEINAFLEELSQHLQEKISPFLDDYGIKLVNFFVNSINVPEDDPAVMQLKNALAKRAEMNIVGYNYAQERSFDTLESAASNPGSISSGLMGAGIGLGLGAGIGGGIGSQMSRVTNLLNIESSFKLCPKCNFQIDSAQRFCGKCGYDSSAKNETNETSNNIVCNACGAKLSENSKFCPECGDRYNPCPNCKADIKQGQSMCEKCGYVMPKVCPDCNNKIAANAKFCPECGRTFIKKCSNCSAAVDDQTKFCPECGTKL